MGKKWVYFFGGNKTDGQEKDRNLVGGKGANLAEMVSLGIPVPPGFTITTEACISFYENDETIVYGIESAKTPSRNSLDIDPATTTITIIQAPEFFDPDQEGDQPAQVNNDHLHLPLIPFPPAKPDGTYAPFYIPWAPASRGSNIVFREIDDPHNWFTIDSTTGGIFVTPEFIVARENGVEEAFGELQYTFAASDETIPYGSSEFCDHLTVTFRFENWNVGVEALASEAAEANGRPRTIMSFISLTRALANEREFTLKTEN